ncbi:MAG: prepilin-type N-terminal cleavage/methylation domain-containing protein [Candidatus Microsaccharimonas sp.]
MSLNNIKSKAQSENGFTIVELLIVVVVIAILAAITIVSYNGITSRANSSAAAAAAATVQKKAELFIADGTTGLYPTAFTDLTGATADKTFYLSGVSATASYALPTSSNGTNTVRFLKCSSTAATSPSQANVVGSAASPPTTQLISGLKITYYDFANSTTKDINIGTTTSCPTS